MKSFKIIQGTSNNITKFEDEISKAMEDGYEFSNDLISKVINPSSNGAPEVLFFQPMTLEEKLDLDNDEDLDYHEHDES